MIKYIFLSCCFSFILTFLFNKIIVFISGFKNIKKIIIDYITIKKVKVIKELQDDYFNSSNKKLAAERHLDSLILVQKQKVEDHLEMCIGYYPSIENLIIGFFGWMLSCNKNFTIPEEGYNHMLSLINYIELNNEYLHYEIIVK